MMFDYYDTLITPEEAAVAFTGGRFPGFSQHLQRMAREDQPWSCFDQITALLRLLWYRIFFCSQTSLQGYFRVVDYPLCRGIRGEKSHGLLKPVA
jgi:hypothetical protein